MSQSKVTSFYTLRKNAKNVDLNSKSVNLKSKIQNLPVISEDVKPVENKCTTKEKVHKSLKSVTTVKDSIVQKTTKQEPQIKPKRATNKTKQSSKKSTKVKKQDISQPKVTSFYESAQKSEGNEKNTNLNTESEVCPSNEINEVNDSTESEIVSDKNTAVEGNFGTCSKSKSPAICVIPASPKRNLINPIEGTPPKKKTLVVSELEPNSKLSPIKMTPRKLVLEPSEEIYESPEVDNVKQKKMSPYQTEEVKKAVENFKNKIAKIRSFESNPYKPTSVISPAKEINKKSSLPTLPAHEKYSYLVDPAVSSSLLLPHKFKVLSEMFRSVDTVVNILNNRKEKITFEKVQEGVQKMMKRNFSKTHFGQLVTIMPDAFDISLEKCNFKKANDPNYELIISPVIKSNENGNKKSKSSNIVIVTPQDLFHRKKQFDRNLMQRVLNYHQNFLNQIHCPPVAVESLTRWHPKFSIDSVPDVEVATLPEVPEKKINSAKDVLNKMLKGPLQNKEKVVKALKEVAEETSSNQKTETKTTCPKSPPTTKSALKGVCPDLIAKIRARESAKLLECMIQSPDEIQRKAMLDRLPKIMQILWHYFIAERKAAVHVDTAIEKIIHSLNSMSSHEDIKAHLTLITKEFPGWLSFVQIRKGLYITMDKNKNLNEMLKNFNCK